MPDKNYKISGWDVETGNFSVWKHADGHLVSSPPNPGTYYFTGGNNSATDYGRQYIDISECVSQIDSNTLAFTMNGDFGGWQDQDDRANLNVTFLDNFEQPIGTATVGGVLASERNRETKLVFRSKSGTIPFGARTIKAELVMTRVEGTNNNAYADNIAFYLTGAQ